MNCNDCDKTVRGNLSSTKGAFCSLCGESVFSLKFPHNERNNGYLIVNISKYNDCNDLIFRLPISVFKSKKPRDNYLFFDDIQNRKLIDIKKYNLIFDIPGYADSINTPKTIVFKNTNNKNVAHFEVTVKDFFNNFFKKISFDSFSFHGKFTLNFAEQNLKKDILFVFFKSWPPITAKPYPYLAENPILFLDAQKKSIRLVLLLNNLISHDIQLKKINRSNYCLPILRIKENVIHGELVSGSKKEIIKSGDKSIYIFNFDISSIGSADLQTVNPINAQLSYSHSTIPVKNVNSKIENIAKVQLYVNFLGSPDPVDVFKPEKPLYFFKGPLKLKVTPGDVKEYELFHRESKSLNFKFSIDNINSDIDIANKFVLSTLYLATPEQVSKGLYNSAIKNCFTISNSLSFNKWNSPKDFEITLNTKSLPAEVIGKNFVIVAQCYTVDYECHYIDIFKVHIKKYDFFESDLAIDFGTSNSCVVIKYKNFRKSPDSTPKVLHLKSIEPGGVYTSENNDGVIPTLIRFTDIADLNNPCYKIGDEAVASAGAYSKNIIKIFKRRFVENPRIPVVDDKGRKGAYSATELAVFFITRMLEMVEKFSEKQIGSFSASYPTKWPEEASTRLRSALEDVSQRLFKISGESNKPKITPPRVDEASACILSSISQMLNDKTIGPITGRGLEFVVGSIDIGGGTTDTSVVKIKFSPEESEQLHFDFIGFGGLADFGGKDITERFAKVLIDKIKEFINTKNSDSFILPVLSENSFDRDQELIFYDKSLSNSDVLFKLAEVLKIGNEPDVLNKQIIGWTSEILFFSNKDKNFVGIEQIFGKSWDQIKLELVEKLRISMSEILDTKFSQASQLSHFDKSVREIIKNLCDQMINQCEVYDNYNSGLAETNPTPVLKTKINKIIIAGGASKDELVRAEIFKNLSIENQAESKNINPKFFVSYGLAWYLEQVSNDLLDGLSFSRSVLHDSVAINSKRLGDGPTVIFREGSNIKEIKYPLVISKNAISPNNRKVRPIRLSVISWTINGHKNQDIGQFKLESDDLTDFLQSGNKAYAFIKFDNKLNSFVFEFDTNKNPKSPWLDKKFILEHNDNITPSDFYKKLNISLEDKS